MLKRALRTVHRWLGLSLAVPLIVQGLSGAVLTLEPVWPDGWRATGTGAPAPANDVLAGAMAVAPAGTRPSRYMPGGDGAAARVLFVPFAMPRAPGSVVQVDPVTAVALGPARPVSGVIEWIKRLHQNWLVPGWGGRQLAGWFGVGLLLLTLLGIPLWWPTPGGWRAAVTVPRQARGWRLQQALHRAAGAWLVVMLLATSMTGMVSGFPQTARMLLGLSAAGGPPRDVRSAERAAAVDLDAALRLATTALPGTVARTVLLPGDGREPVRFLMAPPGRDGAVATRIVATDAAGNRVVSVQGPQSPGEMALRWSHDLHEAVGLGPVWRGLTVLVGLALPLFALTGWAMWLLRRRNRRRVRVARKLAVAAESCD